VSKVTRLSRTFKSLFVHVTQHKHGFSTLASWCSTVVNRFSLYSGWYHLFYLVFFIFYESFLPRRCKVGVFKSIVNLNTSVLAQNSSTGNSPKWNMLATSHRASFCFVRINQQNAHTRCHRHQGYNWNVTFTWKLVLSTQAQNILVPSWSMPGEVISHTSTKSFYFLAHRAMVLVRFHALPAIEGFVFWSEFWILNSLCPPWRRTLSLALRRPYEFWSLYGAALLTGNLICAGFWLLFLCQKRHIINAPTVSGVLNRDDFAHGWCSWRPFYGRRINPETKGSSRSAWLQVPQGHTRHAV
jgi:hypothetical protein